MNFPRITLSEAIRSATAKTRCSTMSSRKPLRLPGISGCAGPKAFIRFSPITARDCWEAFSKRHSFQCYDMLMVIAPATLITLTSLGANLIFALTGLLTDNLRSLAQTAAAISLRMPGQHLSVPVPLRNGDADSGTEADLLSQMETDPLPVYFPGVYLYLYSHGGGRPAEESDLDPDSPHHPSAPRIRSAAKNKSI